MAGVDRLLARAHGLFVGDGADGGVGGDGGVSVPPVPAGGSGVGMGAAAAGGVYRQSQATVSGWMASCGGPRQRVALLSSRAAVGRG